MKRRLFSDKDGTKFGEDLDFFLSSFKHWVKDHLDITEPIIDALKKIEIEIQNGTPTDLIIDKIISELPEGLEPAVKAVYEFFQNNIHKAIEILVGIDAKFDDFVNTHPIKTDSEHEADKFKLASIMVGLHQEAAGKPMSRVDSDTLVQLTYKVAVS